MNDEGWIVLNPIATHSAIGRTLFFEIFAIVGQVIQSQALPQYRLAIKRRLRRVLALAPDQEDGQRLRHRYENISEHLFLFLEDATIPPTNNSSEQAIRMSTIFRKVTNGFRSDWGRDLFSSVRSVVNTGKRQGLSAL